MEEQKKYKVIFQHGNGTETTLGYADKEDEGWLIISEHMNSLNYKNPYIRSWIVNGRKWFDVGSWVEFYILESEEFYEGVQINTNSR